MARPFQSHSGPWYVRGHLIIMGSLYAIPVPMGWTQWMTSPRKLVQMIRMTVKSDLRHQALRENGIQRSRQSVQSPGWDVFLLSIDMSPGWRGGRCSRRDRISPSLSVVIKKRLTRHLTSAFHIASVGEELRVMPEDLWSLRRRKERSMPPCSWSAYLIADLKA